MNVEIPVLDPYKGDVSECEVLKTPKIVLSGAMKSGHMAAFVRTITSFREGWYLCGAEEDEENSFRLVYKPLPHA